MAIVTKQEPWCFTSGMPDKQPLRATPLQIVTCNEEATGDVTGGSSYRNDSYEDSSSSPEGGDGSGKRNRTRSLQVIEECLNAKRMKLEEPLAAIPLGCVPPPPIDERAPVVDDNRVALPCSVSRQFWKAGEFGDDVFADSSQSCVGMDRVRVHPRFLHSNATSHKWALGAFAELLDNALDEVCDGATYVLVDVLTNIRDNSRMLLVEDNGGGMTLDKLRHCMSLGYSAKRKTANTIGQYGNGFKTSTMRLGADVIVFSHCRGADGRSASQSIGMLSYTFLRSTQKEDIVVPMIDYEMRGQNLDRIIRSSSDDWSNNLETILQWSPFTSESDLLKQFDYIKNQGTRIIIYNLWEDDEGKLELDFEADPHDIQIRGVNHDERSLRMANLYPNSRHFLTYKHSLRSYASILYLKLPPQFRIILRGVDVQHHNIVNDMMFSAESRYRPQHIAETAPNDSGMVVDVTVGFVKDAYHHIDIQGFNIYHKNRLIKPFWRVWNAAGSAGRGVIGVLEANFVEPAHDKQGFERTKGLSRLEARLILTQKRYWNENCHHIGYSDKRQRYKAAAAAPPKQEESPHSDRSKSSSHLTQNRNGCAPRMKSLAEIDRTIEARGSSEVCRPCGQSLLNAADNINNTVTASCSVQKDGLMSGDGHSSSVVNEGVIKVKEETLGSTERLIAETESRLDMLLKYIDLENEKRRSLEKKLIAADKKIEELEKEVVEERRRGEDREEKMRERLMDASNTIDELLEMVRRLQRNQISKPRVE